MAEAPDTTTDTTDTTDIPALAARVRAQLQAARDAADLAERTAQRWSWAIGRNVEAANAPFLPWPAQQRAEWPAWYDDATIGLCSELHHLVEASDRALSAWDADVEAGGLPRPDPERVTARLAAGLPWEG
jgi:hypothetical protein